MPSPVMSFEEFMKQIRAEVPAKIEAANREVEGDLPGILEFKPKARERSMLINPNEARRQLKDLMTQHEHTERFLDVVSNVRKEKVEITEVVRGHRDDKRDFILKGRDPDTGVNVMDFRVLLGIPEKKGEDIRNEVTQAAFYKLLKLSAYREKASLREAA